MYVGAQRLSCCQKLSIAGDTTMNTLPRAITARLFNSTNEYTVLQRHWSALVNSERKHELTAAHHVLYLTLLGRDWRRGFTPITNQRKLANGAFYGCVLFRALKMLHAKGSEQALLAPFDGLINQQMLEQARSLVPAQTPYTYSSD